MRSRDAATDRHPRRHACEDGCATGGVVMGGAVVKAASHVGRHAPAVIARDELERPPGAAQHVVASTPFFVIARDELERPPGAAQHVVASAPFVVIARDELERPPGAAQHVVASAPFVVIARDELERPPGAADVRGAVAMAFDAPHGASHVGRPVVNAPDVLKRILGTPHLHAAIAEVAA